MRVYAYTAIVEGVGSVLIRFLKYGLVILILAWLGAAVLLVFQHPTVKGKTAKVRNRIASLLRADLKTSLPVQLATAGFAIAAVAFIGAYFVLSILVLTVSPTQARVLGLEQGRKEIAERSKALEGAVVCDRMSQFPTGCPRVIAFGEKSLAVFFEGGMYRVSREGTSFASVGVQPGSAASAPVNASASSQIASMPRR